MNPGDDRAPAWVREQTILRGLVGSTVYGVGIPGTDDRDEAGICIEPPEVVVGLGSFEQWTFRTQPEGARSGPGDVDVVIFGLRKWARLALKGNPTVLLILFTPAHQLTVTSPEGEELRRMAPLFVSLHAKNAFRGYLTQQRVRLEESHRGDRVNRPELVEQYGFDTKFAMHMLRLGYQGIEFLRTGAITLPMPEREREFLLNVRLGKVPLEEVLALSMDLEAELGAIDVPRDPDQAPVERFLIETYRRRWGW